MTAVIMMLGLIRRVTLRISLGRRTNTCVVRDRGVGWSDRASAGCGGGGHGLLTHVRALRGAGFDVRALVGRDPKRTAERAAKVGVPHGLTSLDEALSLPAVDAVTVAAPPHTHEAIVLSAIAAGKHVLCEKPFAQDTAAARRMFDAAERAGIVHLLGTEFRWSTGQALANRAVRAGVVGEPRMATFLMNMPVLADPAAQVPGWWSRAEEGGGWGPPVISSRVYGSAFTLWIEGDAVHVADPDGVRTLDVPSDLVNAAPDPPPAEFMVTAYDHLHAGGYDLAPYTKLCGVLRDRVLGREVDRDPEAGTFADGVAGQSVLDAIRESSAQRRWVDVG